MSIVFINYRRGETAGEARALFNELTEILGKDSVFMDVDTIALGRDFRQVIRERLESCDLMLALVGRDWVDSRNASGRRRLDDPSDFVRLEIEAALKRNIPVTPVLVQGAQMPTVEQLPEDIRDFAYRNAFELSHNRWESDVREMLKRLGLGKQPDTGAIHEIVVPKKTTSAENSPGPARGDAAAVAIEPGPKPTPWFAIVGASIVAIALAGGGIMYYRSVAEENARIEQAQMEKARADAEAAAQAQRELAAAQEAAAQAEKERAAVQAERERAAAQSAAAQAERERAERERRAAAQAAAEAERKRIAEAAEEERKRQAAAQAEKERIATAQTARERAASEKERMARAQTVRFSGSITVSMGAYARTAGLPQSDLTTRNTMGVCSKWSQERGLQGVESSSFRLSCMQLADFANANGWQLGTKPARQDAIRFCRHTANKIPADANARNQFMEACLGYI